MDLIIVLCNKQSASVEEGTYNAYMQIYIDLLLHILWIPNNLIYGKKTIQTIRFSSVNEAVGGFKELLWSLAVLNSECFMLVCVRIIIFALHLQKLSAQPH